MICSIPIYPNTQLVPSVLYISLGVDALYVDFLALEV